MRVTTMWTGMVVLLFSAAPVGAQQQADTADGGVGRILGSVLDAGTKQPIDGTSVRLSGLDRFAGVTDRRGRFTLVGVPRGVHEIVLEHIRYGAGTYLVNVPAGETVIFDALLESGAIRLDSLIITAEVRTTQLERVGFHRRARLGFGRFFSADEVSAGRIREAIQAVPRLEFVNVGRGGSRRVIFRGARFICSPAIYVDGIRQAWAEGDIEQVVVGRQIEAMEVYRGMTTPPEFTVGYPACGAIVVWTRWLAR